MQPKDMKIKITEYTVLDFKGMIYTTPYHYNVVKLGENMYYRGYDENGVKVTSDIEWASHIAPEFGEEQAQFIKRFFDEFGKVHQWIAFYNKLNGKKLVAITIEGTFQDEVKSTIELIAYENNIQESDIEVRYE